MKASHSVRRGLQSNFNYLVVGVASGEIADAQNGQVEHMSRRRTVDAVPQQVAGNVTKFQRNAFRSQRVLQREFQGCYCLIFTENWTFYLMDLLF